MKKIIRMLVFSAIALYVTSLWNQGFAIKLDAISFLETVVIVTVLYYIVRPISKVILLPLNFISFGLVSVIVYCALFYFVTSHFGLVSIKEWVFPGFHLYFVSLPKMAISSLQNIALSSLSVSIIISTLETLI